MPELCLTALIVVPVNTDAENIVPLLLTVGIYTKLIAVNADTDSSIGVGGSLSTMVLDILSSLPLH